MKDVDSAYRKFFLTVLIFLLIAFFQTTALAQPSIQTDKNYYRPGEQIQVFYNGAPGAGGDWICSSMAGSAENVAGTYQYIPYGATQGRLTFTAPAVFGQYEARAYYNYRTVGYVVSARYAFTVGTNRQSAPATPPPPQTTPRPQTAAPIQQQQNSGAGAGYIASELNGTAKPAGGISESVPVTRTFKSSQRKIWIAVQDVLDEQGYFFSTDSVSGRIKTDPRTLDNQDNTGFFGAAYSVVAAIKVRNSSVSFKARFNKQSNVVMGGTLLEYPEKENQLRKEFFTALEAKLKE